MSVLMRIPMKQALVDRADRTDELVASGRQVDMVFKAGQKALSLRAQKLWHLLVKDAGVKLADNTTHTMALSDLYQTGLGHMTLAERIDTYKSIQLTNEEQYLLADAAAQYRWGDDHGLTNIRQINGLNLWIEQVNTLGRGLVPGPPG